MSESKNYLIVGGRSEAGQSAIEALREFHNAPADARDNARCVARIIATSSNAGGNIPGADYTIGDIDLNDVRAPEKIIETLTDLDPAIMAGPFDMIFFTPAFGPIGYPIRAASLEDADRAIAFSYTPMRELAELLQPRLCVGYSAFYWLPHARVGYGSMAYAKVLLDSLAHRDPERFRAIRGGTFRSPATRGIGLLLQRAIKNTPHAELRELGEAYRATGGKFSDFFFGYAFSQERAAFGERFAPVPHRPTERADLKAATLRMLHGSNAPILCVIGDWSWEENEMPDLDPEIFTIKEEIARRHIPA
jgi:hypothetical protein